MPGIGAFVFVVSCGDPGSGSRPRPFNALHPVWDAWRAYSPVLLSSTYAFSLGKYPGEKTFASVAKAPPRRSRALAASAAVALGLRRQGHLFSTQG
ncbi:hypothetical protein D7W82_23470 [Corallococcus sp. CA049B]|nr:hypothetical protein D7W82_23470 [Corallococcus sp. CA049B]